ncbi:uncharacterized protein N0V89_001192 [Didymosphaeria variabile]|uniref:Uncharacterized protein n=1 Tax=Didymosphaeria variabile TaxID=1932322 RepID=A0A9W8XWQ6_9PLEO|nr:uncharacterized protein N0V89_001192 [Didymosphaeria variabile]KAJ4360626.1 hypothetical protein N0V89_001192 [Didymosphaeria variabile]
MAPAHVPGEQLPLQGQNMYTNSPYQSIYSVDQYDAPSWNSQLQHAALVPDTPQSQTWHHNTYPTQPYSQISSPYVNQGQSSRTASPYQYGQFGNHAAPTNYGHAANVDPSLSNVMRQQQQSPYQLSAQNTPPQGRPSTVTPQSLQHGLQAQPQDPRVTTSYQVPKPTAETFVQRPVHQPFVQPIAVPEYEIPKGKTSGSFYVFDQAALIKATKSVALNKFVTLGTEPFHLPTNRTALPIYTPRQSVKDLKKAGADSKKLAKKAPTRQLSAGRVLKREVSDSESYDDSSDDDSDYSDEEEEPSPLPPTKPEEPQGAFRYDIIKASWYPHRSQPSSEKIKTSLKQLWEIFNTIQSRWRSDSKTLKEAEDQKKTGELPVLKRRVAEQRDLLQSALKSSLELTHPDVLYHLGQVKGFLYLCYQFLANRVKVLDYDGDLPSAILEMLSRCSGTTTTEMLEETKVSKALNVLKKKVNDRHKTLIQKIEDGAAAGSKKAKVGSPPEMDVTAEAKPVKRPATQPAGRTPSEGPLKKLKPTETATNGDKKPATATGISKIVPATQQKRFGEKPAPAPVRTQGIKITNKPSSLFASLNAAGKKPTGAAASASTTKPAVKSSVSAPTAKKTVAASAAKPAFSFKDTMAELLKPKEEKSAAPSKTEKQLPPETPEEKAKRLRKESRRHLRVKFRPGDALVSIKYFHHDPEEETGHDENFVRDAGDIGGEGRMFKQHKEMDDEDDEEEKEMEYRPWEGPSLVDFSVVHEEERKRNYAPYGGGELQPTCPERDANIAHEKTTLEIFYSRPADIPSSPREPLIQQMQSSDTPVTAFGSPPDLVMNRLPESATSATAAPPVPPIDISNLTNIVQQLTGQSNSSQAGYPPVQAPPASAPPAAPAAPTATPDISSILSLLGQGQNQNPMIAPMSVPPAAPAAPPSMDFAQILAMAQQFAQPGNAAFPPPPAGLPNWPGYPHIPQQQQPDMASMYTTQDTQQHGQHGSGSGKKAAPRRRC